MSDTLEEFRTRSRSVFHHTQVIEGLIRQETKYGQTDQASLAASDAMDYAVAVHLHTGAHGNCDIPTQIVGLDLDSAVLEVAKEQAADRAHHNIPAQLQSGPIRYVVTEFQIDPELWAEVGYPNLTQEDEETVTALVKAAYDWAVEQAGADNVMAASVVAEPFCVPVVRIFFTCVSDDGEVQLSEVIGSKTFEHERTRAFAKAVQDLKIFPEGSFAPKA